MPDPPKHGRFLQVTPQAASRAAAPSSERGGGSRGPALKQSIAPIITNDQGATLPRSNSLLFSTQSLTPPGAALPSARSQEHQLGRGDASRVHPCLGRPLRPPARRSDGGRRGALCSCRRRVRLGSAFGVGVAASAEKPLQQQQQQLRGRHSRCGVSAAAQARPAEELSRAPRGCPSRLAAAPAAQLKRKKPA